MIHEERISFDSGHTYHYLKQLKQKQSSVPVVIFFLAAWPILLGLGLNHYWGWGLAGCIACLMLAGILQGFKTSSEEMDRNAMWEADKLQIKDVQPLAIPAASKPVKPAPEPLRWRIITSAGELSVTDQVHVAWISAGKPESARYERRSTM